MKNRGERRKTETQLIFTLTVSQCKNYECVEKMTENCLPNVRMQKVQTMMQKDTINGLKLFDSYLFQCEIYPEEAQNWWGRFKDKYLETDDEGRYAFQNKNCVVHKLLYK